MLTVVTGDYEVQTYDQVVVPGNKLSKFSTIGWAVTVDSGDEGLRGADIRPGGRAWQQIRQDQYYRMSHKC
jgi:hypothetical protein